MKSKYALRTQKVARLISQTPKSMLQHDTLHNKLYKGGCSCQWIRGHSAKVANIKDTKRNIAIVLFVLQAPRVPHMEYRAFFAKCIKQKVPHLTLKEIEESIYVHKYIHRIALVL